MPKHVMVVLTLNELDLLKTQLKWEKTVSCFVFCGGGRCGNWKNTLCVAMSQMEKLEWDSHGFFMHHL